MNLAIFGLAALFEIAGCFAFWLWIRRGATPLVTVLGLASLVAFAVCLTRVDSAFAGRAYAAYGGIYIAASLAWLRVVEGQAPTRTDVAGAALAIAGALVIIGFAARQGTIAARVPLRSLEEGVIVAKRARLRRFPNQPVAEIVQCGEPILIGPFRGHR